MKQYHCRGFIDVYCAERRRAEAEGLTDSSFHGEDGVLNYVNTMFDLFLVSKLKLIIKQQQETFIPF